MAAQLLAHSEDLMFRPFPVLVLVVGPSERKVGGGGGARTGAMEYFELRQPFSII